MSAFATKIAAAWQRFSAVIGVEHNLTSHPEKWISALGALLSLVALGSLSYALVGGLGAGLIVASMGASAVLLFVVPHGALSQPWPVLGGHLLSALVGVCCRELLPSPVLAVALAVSLSILLMQYLRCVHPPGGATALVAVIGGPQIETLGYGYVLQPILLDVLVMLAVALVFNNLFGWRRYPVGLLRRKQAVTKVERQLELTQEDFEAALHKLNTFVDIGTEDLIELVELARQHAEEQCPHPASIEAGRCYSNGRLGRYWCVRQVLDQDSGGGRRQPQRVIYKTMAGDGAWDTGICGYEEFRQWARFEVEAREGRWVRVQADDDSPRAA